LASESPRRKTLLEEAGFRFTVFPVKVSENLDKNLNVNDQILLIAQQKAEAAVAEYANQYKPSELEGYLLLAADTMVVLDGFALGKPQDTADAFNILGRLSGNLHEVKTAICLYESSTEKMISEICTTKVQFRILSSQEILNYISTGEPMDKAGAYGIQGLGGKFVEKIEGPFDNVVGLPIALLKKMFVDNNWRIF
jgi:septum formation protein